MEFSELVKCRYACRKFQAREVSAQILYDILNEAVNAPSAKNSQPWKFYVACLPGQVQKIRACLQDDGRNAFLKGAPAFIVLFEEQPDNIACSKYGNDRFVKYDVGEVCAYITLSAKNKGLDTCIVGWINETRLHEVTGAQFPCGLIIAVGYGDGNSISKKNRIPAESKIINYAELSEQTNSQE